MTWITILQNKTKSVDHVFLLCAGEEEGSDSIFTCALPNTQPERSMCLVRRFSTLSACLAALLR